MNPVAQEVMTEPIYGDKSITIFFDSSKRTKFYKSGRTVTHYTANPVQTACAFEEELGISLFVRKGKSITLTDEGILLKRRALEILNLEERTLEELKGTEKAIEGTVIFGCGEFYGCGNAGKDL